MGWSCDALVPTIAKAARSGALLTTAVLSALVAIGVLDWLGAEWVS
jgi:hypothetical protein